MRSHAGFALGAALLMAAVGVASAEDDTTPSGADPRVAAALKAAGVKYTAHVYPGTQYGFHNDTTPRYDPEAAALAWRRTVATSGWRCTQ